MATIKQHNNLIKVMFGNNNHYKHVLTNGDVLRITNMENRFAVSKLPVCGACERLGLWHHGHTCYCRHCGTITKNPLRFSEYYVAGYDIDPTGLGRDKGPEMAARQLIL